MHSFFHTSSSATFLSSTQHPLSFHCICFFPDSRLPLLSPSSTCLPLFLSSQCNFSELTRRTHLVSHFTTQRTSNPIIIHYQKSEQYFLLPSLPSLTSLSLLSLSSLQLNLPSNHLKGQQTVQSLKTPTYRLSLSSSLLQLMSLPRGLTSHSPGSEVTALQGTTTKPLKTTTTS